MERHALSHRRVFSGKGKHGSKDRVVRGQARAMNLRISSSEHNTEHSRKSANITLKNVSLTCRMKEKSCKNGIRSRITLAQGLTSRMMFPSSKKNSLLGRAFLGTGGFGAGTGVEDLLARP